MNVSKEGVVSWGHIFIFTTIACEVLKKQQGKEGTIETPLLDLWGFPQRVHDEKSKKQESAPGKALF